MEPMTKTCGLPQLGNFLRSQTFLESQSLALTADYEDREQGCLKAPNARKVPKCLENWVGGPQAGMAPWANLVAGVEVPSNRRAKTYLGAKPAIRLFGFLDPFSVWW